MIKNLTFTKYTQTQGVEFKYRVNWVFSFTPTH